MSLSKCRSCGASIVWLKTKAGKNMPCDSHSVKPGETRFLAEASHVPHWQTCPRAKSHKTEGDRPAAKRGPSADQLSLLDSPVVPGGESLPAGGAVTAERAAQLRNFLAEHRISGKDFSAIRRAAGYTAPPEEWDEDTYHEVYALAIATATSMQAEMSGYPVHLTVQGRSPEEVAAAQAEYDAFVARRRAN